MEAADRGGWRLTSTDRSRQLQATAHAVTAVSRHPPIGVIMVAAQQSRRVVTHTCALHTKLSDHTPSPHRRCHCHQPEPHRDTSSSRSSLTVHLIHPLLCIIPATCCYCPCHYSPLAVPHRPALPDWPSSSFVPPSAPGPMALIDRHPLYRSLLTRTPYKEAVIIDRRGRLAACAYGSGHRDKQRLYCWTIPDDTGDSVGPKSNIREHYRRHHPERHRELWRDAVSPSAGAVDRAEPSPPRDENSDTDTDGDLNAGHNRAGVAAYDGYGGSPYPVLAIPLSGSVRLPRRGGNTSAGATLPPHLHRLPCPCCALFCGCRCD